MTRSRSAPEHAYSRSGSKAFWQAVCTLPEPERGELYSAGVLLQNMEETVLHWLEAALQRNGLNAAPPKPKPKPKRRARRKAKP